MKRLIPIATFVVLCLSPLIGAAQMSLGPMSSGVASYDAKVVLPDTVIATATHQINIWNDQLSPFTPGMANPLSWFWYSGTDTIGSKQRDRSYRYTPTGAASFNLTAYGLNSNGQVMTSKTTRMTAVANNGGLEYANLLFIGDSIPAGSNYWVTSTIDSMFIAGGGSGIRRVGTRGSSGNYNECWSGWSINDFVTKNRFKSGGVLNFRAFMKSHADSTGAYKRTAAGDSAVVTYPGNLDYVVIALGVNDVCAELGNNPTSPLTKVQADSILSRMDRLVTGILNPTTGYPKARVIIVPPGYPAENTFGLGVTGYNSSMTWWMYYVPSICYLNQRMMARYDARAYNSHVDVCQAHLNIDRLYGYTMAYPTISSRTGQDQNNYIDTNWIHPSKVGLYQMGDAVYNHLRWESARRASVTNNIVKSEDFTTWGAYAASGSWTHGDDVLAPDGATDADSWTSPDGALAFLYEPASANHVVAADNVLSCYFKYVDAAAHIRIGISTDAGANSRQVSYTLTDATTLTCTSAIFAGERAGYTIEPNGWVRVFLYFPAAAGTVDVGDQMQINVYFNSDSMAGTHTLGVWGAQVESGVYTPSVYMKKS